MHNYIKNHTLQKIDYFKEEIDDITVSISTSNNVPFGTSLATFAYMNRKKDVIANKMWVNYIAYLTQHGFVI